MNDLDDQVSMMPMFTDCYFLAVAVIREKYNLSRD
jgi:hypothetical protein